MSFPRKASDIEPRVSTYSNDKDIARLTAKADLVLEELDQVVRQMSQMLKEGTSP